MVAWRHRKEGVHNGGGGHYFYTGTTREANSAALPTIVNGLDVSALAGPLHLMMSKLLPGQVPSEQDWADFNAATARLPDKPDENLR